MTDLSGNNNKNELAQNKSGSIFNDRLIQVPCKVKKRTNLVRIKNVITVDVNLKLMKNDKKKGID